MGYSDMPFSITSKFSVPGGAEHLVTLRATNAQDFKIRLQEADEIFPTAGFLTWLDQAPDVAPWADEVDPQPDITPDQAKRLADTAARLKAHAEANVKAQARSAQARITKKANGNGNGDVQHRDPPILPDGQTPFEPRCPVHGRAANSRFGPSGSVYCPTQLEDGSYCKWNWKPEPAVRQAVPAGVN